jgi:hypothetical protein
MNDDLAATQPRTLRAVLLLSAAAPISAAFVALAGAPSTASIAAPTGTSHAAVVAGDDPCIQHAALNPMKIPDCAGD